ncbi:MAG: DUF420 domain-containing protein [Campylobacterales bacterium]|nr:DUF420 domain-containing protein [Campylobacterales bacterium]
MFAEGFLGTHALWYMDVATLYFGVLPLLLLGAIILAAKGRYVAHGMAQMTLFVLTLAVVALFEVGVRVSGGFMAFMERSHADMGFMVPFLIVHVLVALLSVVVWSALIYGAFKRTYIEKQPLGASHKRVGRYVFAGLCATSVMGVSIYYLLFSYGH